MSTCSNDTKFALAALHSCHECAQHYLHSQGHHCLEDQHEHSQQHQAVSQAEPAHICQLQEVGGHPMHIHHVQHHTGDKSQERCGIPQDLQSGTTCSELSSCVHTSNMF